MNKSKIFMIAGASMLVLGVPSVVLAQGTAASGPFADVPADHWAYSSVDTLQKAGIVIGYPDGTYGGKRAMTRYEFAVAIARLLPLINKAGEGDYATKDDLAALRSDLEQKLQANSDAIDALRKLVDEFQPELEKLGQDVAAIKDRLDALEARVAAVEEEQRRVKFNGALNIIARSNTTTKGPAFQDANGIFQNFGASKPKHVLANDTVLNDFVLAIKGRVSDTATANVKLDFGNYLASIGNTSAGGPADIGGPAGDTQITLWEANLEQPVSLGPLGGGDLVAGRFGNQWTKYTLMQTDDDVYTYLYQTDSGNIITDGAKVDLKVGPAAVDAWAGKLDQIPFAEPYGGPTFAPGQLLPGGLIPEVQASPLIQGAGVRAVLGNFAKGALAADFEQFATLPTHNPDSNHSPYGVLSVYGLDFNGAFPLIGSRNGLTLDASITDSPVGFDSRATNDNGNGWRYISTDDQAGYTLGALSLKGGYQYVGPDFTAPGSWGKIGAWTNPSNVEGPVGSAKYIVSNKLSLTGDVEGYKAAYGSQHTPIVVQSPLQQGDKLDHWRVGAAYGLTSTYDVDLGYEQLNYELKNQNGTLAGHAPGGDFKPTESFVTIGLGHTFNPNASFKLLYQIIDYKDKGSNFDSLGGHGFDFGGNVAVGQFSVKF